MNTNTNTIFSNPVILERMKRETNYFSRVMFKMVIGLIVTALTSYALVSTGAATSILRINGTLFFVFLLLFYSVTNAAISRGVVSNDRLSASFVDGVFYVRAVMEGVLISPLVFYSSIHNIVVALLSAASFFAFMAMTSIGSNRNYLSGFKVVGGVRFAVAVSWFVNVFWLRSGPLGVLLSCACIALSCYAVCCNMQWLKLVIDNRSISNSQRNKLVTVSALMLHGNIVSMFWHILHILNYFTGSRDK